MELVGILALIVAIQLFFMAIFLFFHYRVSGGSSIFLGCSFLTLGINMLGILAQTTGSLSLPLFWHLLDDTLLLLLGPLLLLFTQSMAYKDFSIRWATAYHGIPFLFFFLLVIWFFPVGEESQDGLNGRELDMTRLIARWVITLFYLHALAYIWAAKKALLGYKRQLKERYSNLEKLDISSVHLVLNTFLLLGIIGAIQLQLPNTANHPFVQVTGLIIVLILFVFVYRSIYLALKGSGWLGEFMLKDIEKYAASTLADEQRLAFARLLTTEMAEGKLYLDPDLSLSQMAGHLGIGSRELSQVINQTFDKNFFDFVNTYRIEQAQKYLSDPGNSMTIQEIMYDVGFSSKSSFNTFFKKKTGKTPSDYRHSFRERQA